MAGPDRGADFGVAAALVADPARFNFFQAVRLLERLGAERGRTAAGGDGPPDRESVRLKVLPALSFPPGAVAKATVRGATGPPELTVAFAGLSGPAGVLPQHYTALMLSRLRAKDATLRDFLDLFHHRLLSQFYRAWEKNRLPAARERAGADPDSPPDRAAVAGLALAGWGTPGLAGRGAVTAPTFLYYAGLLARQPRTASGLEQMLGEYFGWPVRVDQLQGHWFYLDVGNRSQLPPGDGGGPGAAAGLGGLSVLGQRVWDRQSRVRVVAGPLDYAAFQSLLPDGAARKPFAGVCRAYLGLELDVDVQAVLAADAVPWAALTHAGEDGPRLGWNAWSRTHNFGNPVADAIFSVD